MLKIRVDFFFHPPITFWCCDDLIANYNIYRKLPSVRRYMLLSQRCGWSNLKSHRISGRMLGSSSRQPKARLRRYIWTDFAFDMLQYQNFGTNGFVRCCLLQYASVDPLYLSNCVFLYLLNDPPTPTIMYNFTHWFLPTNLEVWVCILYFVLVFILFFLP